MRPLPALHLELWVSLRKNRLKLTRALREAYRIARPITHAGGASGPWVFLVDPDPANPKPARLRTILAVRRTEDLWVELVFYPSKARMRKIIQRIWKKPQMKRAAAVLDGLISRRKTGYQATIAYGVLKAV